MKKLRIRPLSDDEILKEVVGIISEYLPDARVYLFGSRAEGTAKPYSDFNIAVEWKEKIPLPTIVKIRTKLEKLPTLKSFDLVDLNRMPDFFVKAVRKRGVILYDGRRLKNKA